MDISDHLHIEVLMARAVLQFFSSFLLLNLPYVPGLIPKENSSTGIHAWLQQLVALGIGFTSCRRLYSKKHNYNLHYRLQSQSTYSSCIRK